MFAILNCIGDASRDHGSPSPPPWHLAPSKGGGWRNGITGMVQNDHLPGNQLGEGRGFMEGRDECSAMTGKLR